MVESAARLLAQRGLQATSFSEVLEAASAPRGSVYHHFPRGKDQLVKAAIESVDGTMRRALETKAGAPAMEIAAHFLDLWRTVLTRSQFKAGCAVVAVTIAADSKDLLEETRKIFREWRQRLAAMLAKGGLDPREAEAFAAMLIAASEGAVIVSRGEQSLEPFEIVAEQLLDQLGRLMHRGGKAIRGRPARPHPRRRR